MKNILLTTAIMLTTSAAYAETTVSGKTETLSGSNVERSVASITLDYTTDFDDSFTTTSVSIGKGSQDQQGLSDIDVRTVDFSVGYGYKFINTLEPELGDGSELSATINYSYDTLRLSKSGYSFSNAKTVNKGFSVGGRYELALAEGLTANTVVEVGNGAAYGAGISFAIGDGNIVVDYNGSRSHGNRVDGLSAGYSFGF